MISVGKCVLALALIGIVGAAVVGGRSNAQCGENEIWNECPSCETTCSEPAKDCPVNCPNPGCMCIENHFRNEQRKCVASDSCKLDIGKKD
ncbi:hypothetical protein L596_013916 [Steinernema carpocapsae]|uniref:TIL domain-containing protein n=1 Tax=Steinernema carpocapsae TaxID=34508 RepID=A0A4U5P1M8_STECR|nr:hypothetical protein L596_013916 [Steinernema carpocapsae]